MQLFSPVLYVAIPAMDELVFLPKTIHAIENQDCTCRVDLYVCINQPDSWWNVEDKKSICEQNSQLFNWLASYNNIQFNLIDRFSKGNGWSEKRRGVGSARKVLFDTILEKCKPQDVIVSLDADTLFSSHYFQSLYDRFATEDDLNVISVPYYHPLSGDETADKAMLRYEIYMRNWALNMERIGSPYSFTALGSAIAVRASALKKIGGITPLRSGEDFYLLQKLRKMTPIATTHPECVYPATRFSNRVDFGTGPAMLKGVAGDWSSYPIFHYSLFDEIRNAYERIEELFDLTGQWKASATLSHHNGTIEQFNNELNGKSQVSNPNSFISFLAARFRGGDLWGLLRTNFKTFPLFERAFHNHADGLRISQYLKERQRILQIPDRKSLIDNMQLLFHHVPNFLFAEDAEWSVKQLQEIREIFYKKQIN